MEIDEDEEEEDKAELGTVGSWVCPVQTCQSIEGQGQEGHASVAMDEDDNKDMADDVDVGTNLREGCSIDGSNGMVDAP